MSFTPYAIEKFISARISKITACNAQDLVSEFPSAKDWVSGLGLMIIFNNQPAPEMRAFALQFIRRCEMALAEYGNGCAALQDLVSGHNGRWSPYFRALSYFEVAIGQLYQVHDYSRKLIDRPLFEKNDGSPLQRLNTIYNAAKHKFATDEQPVWITNHGLEAKDARITFAEIEELLRVCARLSETLTRSAEGCRGDA